MRQPAHGPAAAGTEGRPSTDLPCVSVLPVRGIEGEAV